MRSTVKRVEIEARKQLRAIVRAYFLSLDEAARDPARRVAWCTSVGPCEILRAFGFEVYFPENHGALLGARKVSHQYIPRAVAAGYCAESCSYMTSDIGSAIAGYSPLTDAFGIAGPPRPDLLTYNTNQCREVQEWWSFFGKRYDVDVLGITPPPHLGTVAPHHIAFVRMELEKLVATIEKRFGLQLDYDRLGEVVALSSRASRLWCQVLDTCRSHPSPFTFFDGLVHMSPVILMRGTQTAVDYYELLLEEMNSRVAQGVAAVANERFRIYWEGMPVWPRMRDLSDHFFDLGAAVLASTYCNSWAFDEFSGGDPLTWMAKTSTEIFINRDEAYKQRFLRTMFHRFDIDGAVFHNARTCPNNTNSRFGMAQRLRDECNIPILVIDGDLSDVRFFSSAQTMTNIEAFIEQLEERIR